MVPLERVVAHRPYGPLRLTRSKVTMRVYSPTQTATYIECPMKRALHNIERWRPQRAGKKELAGILGTAFAAGIGLYNSTRQQLQQAGVPPASWPIEQITSAAVALALQRGGSELERLEARRVIGDYDRAQRDALPKRIPLLVRRHIENDPLPPEWAVVAVEQDLGPEAGHARIDLVVDDGNGPVIIDYKVKLRLEKKYRDRDLARYRLSRQMYHYAHFYSQVVGQPVARYQMVVTVAEPFEIVPLEETVVHINPETLQQWLVFSQATWADMEAEEKGERPLRGQTECETMFGACEFRRACWDFHYDETLMETEYVREGQE